MRIPRIALAFMLSALAACTPRPSPPGEGSAAPPPAAAPGAVSSNPVESLGLEVVLNDQTTSGRLLKLRGLIVNPHAQVVSGVRLQLVFVSPTGTGMKVLEIQQKEMAATIPPGENAMLSWDVESLYLGSGRHFLVAAYPARLGDADQPVPDNWQE